GRGAAGGLPPARRGAREDGRPGHLRRGAARERRGPRPGAAHPRRAGERLPARPGRFVHRAVRESGGLVDEFAARSRPALARVAPASGGTALGVRGLALRSLGLPAPPALLPAAVRGDRGDDPRAVVRRRGRAGGVRGVLLLAPADPGPALRRPARAGRRGAAGDAGRRAALGALRPAPAG